jgi:anti-sigma-K factor RskA
MKLDQPDLQSRLAAEYVLGTMKGGARRRFEEYLRDNRALREAVAQWEAHLTPLSDFVPAITPPSRVWRNIEARTTAVKSLDNTRTFSQNAAKTPVNTGVLANFANFAFWSGLGVGAASVVAALFVAMSMGMMQPKDAMLTAVLEDQGVARMVIEQPKSNLIMVKMVKPWKTAANNSLQLWVLPKDGQPRSIGIINQDGTTKIAMAEMDAMLTDGTAFALSKEPMGGSPTGQPTGMILCKGVIAKMPVKKAAGQI